MPTHGELRILMLEDVPEEAEVLERELHKSGLAFVVQRVQTKAAFGAALEQFAPDLILADSKLPGFDGHTALEWVRRKDPLLPVIMVTGALGDERAVEFLVAGASDYVLKDRLARLGPAVRRALSDAVTSRARQEAEEKIHRLTRALHHLSYFDRLTGLANRTLFCERLARVLGRPPRSTSETVVAVFNVQCLSLVNDSLGRPTGDLFLECVTERLKQRFDGSDPLAHLGGGTFAAIFRPDAPEFTPHEQIRAVFAEPLTVKGRDILAPVKCGLARFPADGSAAETLVQNAEVALNAARGSGSHFLYYRQEMSSGTAERLALELRLRDALNRGEFVVYYQPQVHRQGNRIVGVEALLRWRDPERGLVPPDMFLPVLVSTGLIVAVGEWVARQAAEDCDRWRRLRLPPMRVSVNVSTLELSQPGFVERFLDIARAHDRSRIDLDVEITEGELLKDSAAVIEGLQQLRGAGVRVAIDDFGTGYSSLSRLSELPIDVLKIDRSFISRLTPDRATHAIVATIVALARSYDLETIAEGVETAAQLGILETLGCLQSQGYLHSPPVAAETLEALLGRDPQTTAPLVNEYTS